jgi:hypothetical protein
MTALADRHSAVEIHLIGELHARAESDVRLRLVPSGEGWSLVGPSGELVFNAIGTRARRRCLEFARERGVLAIF